MESIAHMIDGHTRFIAHLGYPTASFKAPMIYNPYFEHHRIRAVVVPMSVTAENFSTVLSALRQIGNFHGALVTMPHKVSAVDFLDEASTTVLIAGSCNAIRRTADGSLQGDMFDGEGFVRAAARSGRALHGARILVTGCGGVGSAIAASAAGAGVSHLSLFDSDNGKADRLAGRLHAHYHALSISTESNDPAGHNIIVNATPLGMSKDDPLPIDVRRVEKEALVADVVLTATLTPLLLAAQARGCKIQVGTDMLFEQIPAYLEFFGLRAATVDELRRLAQLDGCPSLSS